MSDRLPDPGPTEVVIDDPDTETAEDQTPEVDE